MGRVPRQVWAIALVAALAAPVAADDTCQPDAEDPTLGCMPPGTLIQRPGGPDLHTEAVRFAVSREQLDRAVACPAQARALERRLEAALAVDKSSPVLRAMKWAAVGAAIAISFWLGTMVR